MNYFKVEQGENEFGIDNYLHEIQQNVNLHLGNLNNVNSNEGL